MTSSAIILVHGTTLREPPADATQWYQPGSAFCRLLDQRLAEAGGDSRCWFQFGQEIPCFNWAPGDNDWVTRSEGAAKLRRYLMRLSQPCHIVAHSHGGNVVLDALGWNTGRRSDRVDWFEGTVTLLGTPIIEHVTARRSYWPVFYTALVGAAAMGLLRQPQFSYLDALVLILALLLSFVVLLFVPFKKEGMYSLAGRLRRLRLSLESDSNNDRLLVINSEQDEALRFLQAVLKSPNPLVAREHRTMRKRLMAFVGSEWRHAVGGGSLRIPPTAWITLAVVCFFLVSLIAFAAGGARFWYWSLIVLLPTIGLAAGLGAAPLGKARHSKPIGVRALAGATLTVFSRFLQQAAMLPVLAVLRRMSWSFIQTYALGFGGGRINVSSLRVEASPLLMKGCLFKTLPADFLKPVIERRQFSAQGKVAQLIDRLESNEWSVDAIQNSFRDLELPDLIHTSYCSNLEHKWVIDQIVAHIIGYEREGDGLATPVRG